MEYPQATGYRKMGCYFAGYTPDGGNIVYVCGDVFRFNDARPNDYKPFIVKAYISPPDIVTLATPVIAFGKRDFHASAGAKGLGFALSSIHEYGGERLTLKRRGFEDG